MKFDDIMKIFKTKKNNQSFGIFHEGQWVKIAHLELSETGFVIKDLVSSKLKSSLFDKTIPDTDIDTQTTEENDSDFNYVGDDFELPDLSEESMGFSGNDLLNMDNKNLKGSEEDLLDILRKFSLDQGVISLNANDENISYHEYDESISKKNYKKEIEATFLTPEEKKEKKYVVDYIENSDESVLAFLYKGEFELLEYLEDVNQLICKDKLLYNHIGINELSLINFIIANHTLPEDENVLILYLDSDYKIGVVVNGDCYVKNFSIDVPEAPIHEMRQTVYSKIMLEKDSSNIDITKHIIISGEMSSEDDIEFFKDKLGSKSVVERVRFRDIEKNDETSPEQISKFALPLSLAWRVLINEEELIYQNNLLPQKIIDGQKHFKLSWHGYIILVVLFILTFYGTFSDLRLKNNIARINRDNSILQQKILTKENILKRINTIEQQISIIDKDYSKITSVIGHNNQMHLLLNKLSVSMSKNTLSWVTELLCDKDGILLKGSTTKRTNVIKISEILPGCTILSVIETKKVNYPVWDFQLKFDYPQPINIKKDDVNNNEI